MVVEQKRAKELLPKEGLLQLAKQTHHQRNALHYEVLARTQIIEMKCSR